VSQAGSKIEVFIDEDESGSPAVALVMVDPGIVEFGEPEELTPAVVMTAWHARCLAHSLVELADELEPPR
jgi:hypothetical protein